MVKKIIAGVALTAVAVGAGYASGNNNSKTKVQNLETKVEQMQTALDESEANLAEARLALAQKSVDLDEKTALLAEKETLLAEKDEQIAAKDARIAELEEQLESTDDTEIAELQAQITTLQNEKATLVSEKETLQSEVDTLTAQVTELNSQIETLQARITELENSETETTVAVASVSDFRIEDGYITTYRGSTVTDIVFPSTYSLDSSGNAVDGTDFTIKGLRSSIFFNDSTLQSVVIPDTYIKIGRDCFRSCTNLTYNEYDNGYYIGSETNPYMFLATVKSTDITSITIHPDTKIIGGAFRECTSLEMVVIPEGVTVIEDYAFHSCSALTTLSLPNTLERVGRNAFVNCTNLTYTEYNNGKYLGNETNPYMVLFAFVDSTATSFSAHVDTKIVGGTTGLHSTTLTTVTLPDGVLSISDYAFIECNALAAINLGNSIKYIGENAFMNAGLTNLTIPDTAVDLYRAFYRCLSLTDVTIADNVEFNVYNTFYGCTALTNISYTRSHELSGYGSYLYKDGVLTILSMSDFDTKPIWAIDDLNIFVKEIKFACQPTHISKNCFLRFSVLKTLILPNSVTQIATTAFGSCSALTNLTLPENLQFLDSVAFKSVGTLAFNELNGGYYLGSETNPYLVLVNVDSGLTEFTVHEDTKLISNFTFQSSATTLTNVILPEGLISITHGAFLNCSALITINLPSTLTYLTTYSFYGCSSLTTINLPCAVPPTIKYQAQAMDLTGVTINIPAGSLELYQIAEYWSECGATFVENEE